MEQSLTIYKASAGSGKTFALTVEYILQLMQPHAEGEFAHTLAVTFTNKATAEMKGRILETLYGLKHRLEETRFYMEAIRKRLDENGTPMDEALVSGQAARALTAILHDYSHFRVETIDSFFQSILRGMARELGLAANLQVELSHDEVVASAVDSLIETMDEQPEVKRWVMEYVREQLDSGDKWDIVTPLKAFAGNIFSEEYQRRSEAELARISDAEVIKVFKSKMQAIRKHAEQEVQKAVDEVMSQIEDFSQICYGKNLCKFLLEAREMKSEGPGKSIETVKFKGSKALPQGGSGEGALQDAYSRLLALYEECRKDYLSAGLALRHLSLLRLLENIDERAKEIEGDTGRFTLSSTPVLLSKMIEGSDAPFIFEKIGTFVNNVMIDEFQDTSRMQWENFKKLLFEKLASGGKGLLVGDIKQSIYRWRNGDWKILYGIEEEREFGHFHIHPKVLDTNYRSHQTIVDFNNTFFPRAATLLDAVKPDAGIKLSRIYGDVRQRAKKEDGQGFVRVKLYKQTPSNSPSKGRSISSNQSTAESLPIEGNCPLAAEQLGSVSDGGQKVWWGADMAEQIRLLHKGGLDLSEMAVLVRTNLMARQLIEGFSQFAPDIRLVSDEAFLLEASTSVQMIVAALRLLIDKDHKDGISEKYLMLHYLRDVLGHDTSLQNIALQQAEQVLPEAFIAHQEELLQLPLYLLAERLWHIFSLGNIEGEDVFVLTFMDELQNHLQGASAPDIQTFLTAWDEKLHLRSIPGSSVAGVRILTIHKSKGLEFHTVLLPFSHWQIEADRQGDILWCETQTKPYNELGALPISIYSKDVRSSVFAPNYEEEHLERRVDALNTLYVAFTRATSNLYVWGKTKPHTAGELIYETLRNEENDTDETCFTYEVGQTPSNSPSKGRTLSSTESTEESIPIEGEVGRGPVNRLHLEHSEKDAVDVKVVTRNPTLYFRQSNQAEDYLEQMRPPSISPQGGSINSLPLGQLPVGSGAIGERKRRRAKGWEGALSQREIGKRMHEVLSRVNDVSQLEEVFMQAREEGLIDEGKDWNTITNRIKEGFQNPLVSSWFNSENTVYNECGIASIDAKTGLPCILRPDRVIMTKEGITVVDYKFGHPSRHYYDQVREYMNLMRRMYPDRKVQGYIWYIMGKGVVPVHSS